MINHLIYILVCVLLALSINKDVLSASAGVFAAIGFIGLWRYSWALINFIRATLYINQSFPKLRKNAVVQFEQKEAIPQTFFLVT
ncbi:MAG: glycosyltransferase, partial [Lentilitoribacter sp.]